MRDSVLFARLIPLILMGIYTFFKLCPFETAVILGILMVIAVIYYIGEAVETFCHWLNNTMYINPCSFFLANASIIGALAIIWTFRWELLNTVVLYAIILVSWFILLWFCTLIENRSTYMYSNDEHWCWVIIGIGAIATLVTIVKFYRYILIGIATPIIITIVAYIIISIDASIDARRNRYYYY